MKAHNPSLPSEQEDFPVAQLEILDCQAIQNGHQLECKKLFDTSCVDGFFYLDIGKISSGVSEAIDDVYALEKELFDLDEELLMRYDIDDQSPRKLNGYKPMGRNFGELTGQKDGFQSFAVAKDRIMKLGDQSVFKCPDLLEKYQSSLRTVALAVSTAASALFSALSTALQLAPEDDLRNVHRTHLPSPDLIRLLKYHPQPESERHRSSHIPHTDMGSLTFLFTRQYGLQVQQPKLGDQWRWVVPPLEDFVAIVNVGDTLSHLTGGKLRSCLHRVMPLPSPSSTRQETEKTKTKTEEQDGYRYSFAYLMRAEDETPMKVVASPLIDPPILAKDDALGKVNGKVEGEGGQVMTCAEWMRKKYAVLRRDTWSPEKDWILTGAKASQ